MRVLDAMNVCRDPRKVLAALRGMSIFLSTSNWCQLRCIMCGDRNCPPRQWMSVDTAQAIFDRLRGRMSSLQFSCSHEDTLNPSLPSILGLLPRYHIPMVVLYTNGQYMPDDLAAAVVDVADEVCISVGECDPELYERIHVGARWDRLVGNVEKLRALRRRRRPTLAINATLMRDNIAGLPAAVDYWAGRVEAINGRPWIRYTWTDAAQAITDWDFANGRIGEARKIAGLRGVRFSMREYKGPEHKHCRAPSRGIWIGPEGETAPCPRLRGVVSSGRILDGGLQEDLLIRLQQDLDQGTYRNPVCAVCNEGRECEEPLM